MGYFWESIITIFKTNIASRRKAPEEESTSILRSFVPSNIPKFKYSHLHKGFKMAVVENYSPIEDDIIVFRAVSADISEKDFIPMTIDKIQGEDMPQKKDIDWRSISFFNTISACEIMAIQKYENDIHRIGSARAEQWRSEHPYVIKVTLRSTDGYVDSFTNRGHLNFAPFNSFMYKKNIDITTMREINYTSPYTEIGVLQGGDGKKYVTLYYQGNYKYCIEVIQETSDDTIKIPQLSSNDVLKYINGCVSLKRLAQKKSIVINSNLTIYGFISESYDIDSHRIKIILKEDSRDTHLFLHKIRTKLRIKK